MSSSRSFRRPKIHTQCNPTCASASTTSVRLQFGDEPDSVDIKAMYSGEGECVPFANPNLKARNQVEDWLGAVEENMKDTLRKAMKHGLLDYDHQVRSEWVGMHPGQVVATVAQMTARGTEQALLAEDPVAAMKAWYDEYVHELLELIVKIRGSLTKLQRKVIVALVTTDVHARDIIEMLYERKVGGLIDSSGSNSFGTIGIRTLMIHSSSTPMP